MNKKVIHTIIDHHAVQHPDRIAIDDADHSVLTYAALKDKSDNCAFVLGQHQVDKGAVVAVFIPESSAYVTAILGVNKNGNIFMPLLPGYPRERLLHLLRTVRPQAIITSAEYLEEATGLLSASELPDKCHLIDINTAAPIAALPVVEGDDSNYLIYTSGSTGEPKIIEGVHKSMSHFLHWEMQEFKLDEHVRTALLAPVSFDVSFRDIFVPLLSGGTLHIPERSVKTDPVALLAWIDERKITLLHMVPSIFRLLIKMRENQPAALPSLRNILLAGEPLYYRDVENWRKQVGTTAELTNLYGPTETTLAKVFFRIGDITEADGSEIVPLGFPLPNTIVLILNNANQICQIGEIGEICIKTPFRTKGYYKTPELTAEKFTQNPLHDDFEDIIYRTGDLGKYGADRSILIVGRKDSQVKIRGNRVELPEIEKVISRFNPVTQIVVMPHQRGNGELVLTAYYTASGDVDKKALTVYMSNFLPDYMFPSYYVQLDEFPLNINGKVNKKALPAPEDLLYEQLEFTPPSTREEHLLCNIFAEVLGLKKVGVDNSFFEIGGHSLNAVKVISRLYKETNRQISLKFFFEHPTIRLLAASLPEISTTYFLPIPSAAPASLYPVSHSQKRLLVLDQVTEKLTAYNMVTACFFAPSLNVEAFKQAFDGVIVRHQVFSTRFVYAEGAFWQYPVSEHAGLLVDTNEERTPEQLIAEEQAHYFDLYNDLLYRARLIRLRDKKYFFIMNIHHIISDGWSMNVFTRELLTLYNAQPLPVKRQHYTDYAVWQVNRLAEGALDAHKAYWHTIMQELPTGQGLPSDGERTNVAGFDGDLYTMLLNKEVVETLKKIAASNNTGLFPILLSLIKVLLYVKSGNEDIITGVPVAGRNHPDLEDQIGFFLNNVVLRTRIRRDAEFTDLLKQVHNNVLQALEHQEYPFDKLVEELTGAQPSSAVNPFYNVLVVMNNSGLNISNDNFRDFSEQMGMQLVDIPTKASKLDLTFFLMEEQEHVKVELEYNTNLFKPNTIARYAEDLERLAVMVTGNPGSTISNLSWALTAKEKKAQLESKINLISEDF